MGNPRESGAVGKASSTDASPTPADTAESMFHDARNDLKHGLRSALKSPLASLTIVLSLALGMGITTTAFSILNAMALADLPGVRDQDRLVTLGMSFQGPEGAVGMGRLAVPDLHLLQEQSSIFSEVAASGPMQMAVDAGGGAEVVEGEVVTANYFRTLGAIPLLGRFFTPDEAYHADGPASGAAVTVLSHRYWRARFGEDPEVIGGTIHVNGHPLEVVGIAGEGFTGMTPEDVVDGAQVPLALWVPLARVESIHPPWAGSDPAGLDARWLRPVARLAEGVSLEAAAASLPALAGRVEAAYPGARSHAELVHGDLIFGPGAGSWRPALTVLGFMVVPVIVLLVACANAANLLLARNASRRREMAIRRALGARRPTLLRQLLAESGILALAAGTAGLLVALGARKVASLFSLHLSMDIPLDLRVFTFTLSASLATGLLFGLIPALRATRMDSWEGLRSGSRGAVGSFGDSRLRNGLVVVQVALGLLLLVSSGLFVRSAQHGLTLDSGMEEDRLLLMSLDLDLLGYQAQEGRDFYRQLVAELRGVPGVEAAALAEQGPLQGHPSSRVAPASGEAEFGQTMAVARVGARFLESAGISLRTGRGLSQEDMEGPPGVAVVNQAAAERLFPGASPLGRRLSVAGFEGEVEVVGVAANTRASLYRDAEPMVYLPRSDAYVPRSTLFIRTDGAPEQTAPAVRDAALALDPRLPVKALEPARILRRRLLAPWRLGYLAMGFLGSVAVTLAGAGLYGVLAYAVSQRTREIGVRMALGAGTGRVVGMVLWGAFRLLAAGAAAGFLLSGAAATLLRSALFGVSPLDPWVYGRVGLLLVGITLVAALLPAVRAASVEPVRAMAED